nr:phosphotransferase family protein [Acidimicrobiia bacterium]
MNPAVLGRALAIRAPGLGVESIAAVHRFPAGLSSQSWRVDAATGDGPVTWVMRREPEFGVIPPYDLAAEARLMQAAAQAGVPVPAVVHVETDADVLGARFLLMEYVEGETYRSQDAVLASDPGLTAALQDEFVDVLARIHRMEQDVLPGYRDSRDAARAHVAECRRRMAETEVLPHPLVADTLDMLEELAPADAPLVLCHGDYRLPNLKWSDRRIVGVLDWELARVTDPMADLAFTQTVGAGPCAVMGPLAARYADRSGNQIDETRLAFHRALEMAKSVIIGLAGAYDLASGGDDLRLLSTAGLAGTGESIVGMLRTQFEALAGVNP